MLTGDSPYVIDPSNRDNCSLMLPQNLPLSPHNVVSEPTVWASTVLMRPHLQSYGS